MNHVTQKDLAKALQISQRTVSEAFKPHGKINPVTKAKILQKAQEMGYRPHSAAQAARTGRLGAVGLLIPNTIEGVYLPLGMVRGIMDGLKEFNMHLVIDQIPPGQIKKTDEIPKILRQLTVDGLLINIFHTIAPEDQEIVTAAHLPSIWLNSKFAADCVYPDDIGNATLATEYLLKRGHRKIAFLRYYQGNPSRLHNHYSVQDRWLGYAKTMEKSGLTPREILIEWTSWTLHYQPERDTRLAQLIEFLRHEEDRPSAILCYEERELHALLLASYALGLQIPNDLSIVTISNNFAEYGGIPVDTVMLNFDEVGKKGARLLVQKIEYPETPLSPCSVLGSLVRGLSSRDYS